MADSTTISKKRVSKEYQIKRVTDSPSVVPPLPSPQVRIEPQPEVRSVIHDVLASRSIQPARTTASKGGRGSYILVPINLLGSADGPMAQLPIDMEWYSISAYPSALHRYLLSGYTFDYRPSRSVIDDSDVFLRNAFHRLRDVGLNISFGQQLGPVFQELTTSHRDMKESSTIRNKYLLLAYAMTRLLFENRATYPLRLYSDMSFPAVIAASFINRAVSFYQAILSSLKIDVFLIKTVGRKKGNGFNNIPNIASDLSMAALYTTERIIDKKTSGFTDHEYYILQNIVLNIPDIDQEIIDERIQLPLPTPRDQTRIDMRCNYFIGLLKQRLSRVSSSTVI